MGQLDLGDFPLVWAVLPLVGALLLAAGVIEWVRRWRARAPESGMTTGDQLAHFRQLYERGELNEDEYQRIRGLLGERMRQELAVPGKEQPDCQVGPTDAPGATPERDEGANGQFKPAS